MIAKTGLMAIALTLGAGAVFADPNTNEKIVAEAARRLSWDYDNQAYFLVKQETVVAPVALIFGYADNADACQRLAETLSQPEARAGTFECVPIF